MEKTPQKAAHRPGVMVSGQAAGILRNSPPIIDVRHARVNPEIEMSALSSSQRASGQRLGGA